MSNVEWTGTGETQYVDGGQLTAIDRRLEDAIAAAERSGAHLWTASVVFRVDPRRVLAGDSPMLDSETMLCAPMVGCYVCERPFEPSLLYRRCKGDPRR